MVFKDDISVPRKSIETQRGLKKKRKEIGFPIKTGAICHPDIAKPKLQNNSAGFTCHLFDFELKMLSFFLL